MVFIVGEQGPEMEFREAMRKLHIAAGDGAGACEGLVSAFDVLRRAVEGAKQDEEEQ